MAIVYYPGCRFREFLPDVSQCIESYMQHRFDAVIVDCCRPGHGALSAGDCAVTICNTCRAIISERSPAQAKSVWELIAEDRSFPFPSFKNRRMALQDCWRSRGCHEQQQAVRDILRLMNVHVVELPESRDDSSFCGTTLLSSLPLETAQLAPRRFVIEAQGLFVQKTPEEQLLAMSQHCANIAEELVVCYCVPCAKGIRLGGKRAVHLAELVFGKQVDAV